LNNLSLILVIVLTSALCSACSSADNAMQHRVKTLANERLGKDVEIIPNTSGTLFLCLHKEKEKPRVPIQPVRFFVYDGVRDTIVHERELENGSVQWASPTTLEIKRIPGAITGDEDPGAFSEIYDVTTSTTSKR